MEMDLLEMDKEKYWQKKGTSRCHLGVPRSSSSYCGLIGGVCFAQGWMELETDDLNKSGMYHDMNITFPEVVYYKGLKLLPLMCLLAPLKIFC